MSEQNAQSLPNPTASPPPSDNGHSRRAFLGRVGAAAAAGAVGLPTISGCDVFPNLSPAQELAPGTALTRKQQALMARVRAAESDFRRPAPIHQNNGDEGRYSPRIGNFSKGLPHNNLGEVNESAYQSLLTALNSGRPSDFEAIVLGSTAPRGDVQKLVNPQAGLAFDLQGADSHGLTQPAAPRFDSAEEAGEIVENYWMALCRDIPFAEYDTHPLTQQAAANLSGLADFRGPKSGGAVTTATLFRGLTPGDLVGPYISQFLLRPAPFGVQYVEQKMRTYAPGIDFMTGYSEWLNIQNGGLPAGVEQFLPTRRYTITGRDLAQWVHIDVLFQAYFNACLICGAAPNADLTVGGIGAPLNVKNPYRNSLNQIGFGTLGAPWIKATLCEVATRALKAVWFQKWNVHRRLRPEEFAGRIHNHITGAANYPIHADALNSPVLSQVFGQHGTYLLPMAFPEGCPKHPAYGAGHATVAGACVTILKAVFDETFVIPNPLVPDPSDPTQLVAYSGPTLTVGGELNKLASNVAIGRDIAGVHWRSDATESLLLGEQVAITLLQDQKGCFNEQLEGFQITKFDGTTVTI